MRVHFHITVVGLLLAFVSSAQAVTLTMVSSPSDLSNLLVGDSVQIDVNLGDLTGAELTSLGGTVEVPAANFATPFNEAAGLIVPDASDLILTPLAGLIDGQFFAFLGSNITSDGTFFSFEITATAPGSGVIAFDPLSLFAEDVLLGPIFDFTTNELPFTIRLRDTGAAIPEPASVALALLGLTALSARRRRHPA